jgi:hypothetical protein
MRTINRNPLGVRKLDVQDKRRKSRAGAKEWAWQRLDGWIGRHGQPSITDIEWLLIDAYNRGWEDGVRTGSQAQLSRLREALQRGTLVKP